MIREEYKWLTETYVAHRGFFDNITVPENSIPAFELAVQNGFGIETDVQASKDGVLVVFHDDTLDRMTGIPGKLCDYTFEELRAMRLGETQLKIPTFEEFLQAANGTNLIVEIKTHDDIGETEEKVYKALKGYKGNYCIESFNPFIVHWFRQNAPEVIRGQLSCSYEGDPDMPKYQKRFLANLGLSKWNGSQFIAYDAATIATCKAVKKWAKRVPIICWTIKSQAQLEQLSPYFDNIIFDSFLPRREDVVFGKPQVAPQTADEAAPEREVAPQEPETAPVEEAAETEATEAEMTEHTEETEVPAAESTEEPTETAPPTTETPEQAE